MPLSKASRKTSAGAPEIGRFVTLGNRQVEFLSTSDVIGNLIPAVPDAVHDFPDTAGGQPVELEVGRRTALDPYQVLRTVNAEITQSRPPAVRQNYTLDRFSQP